MAESGTVMGFGVRQRLLLLMGLPWQGVTGNVMTLRLVREFREALSFDEEEHEQLRIREEGSSIKWDGDRVKDIRVGPKVAEIVVGMLGDLERAEALREEHLELCDLFGYAGEEAAGEG